MKTEIACSRDGFAIRVERDHMDVQISTERNGHVVSVPLLCGEDKDSALKLLIVTWKRLYGHTDEDE